MIPVAYGLGGVLIANVVYSELVMLPLIDNITTNIGA